MCGVQRYAGPVKPTAAAAAGSVLDGVSSSSGRSQSQCPSHAGAGAGRYSVARGGGGVSALVTRLVASSVRFNADLPLANVFAAGPAAHLLLHGHPRAAAAAAAADNKVTACGCVLVTFL